MTEQERAQWADGQVKALLAAGVDALDAENTVGRALVQIPEWADPNTWLPLVEVESNDITEADIDDARADWYAQSGPKFARLLDATEFESEA